MPKGRMADLCDDIFLHGLAIATAVRMPVGSIKPLTKSTKLQIGQSLPLYSFLIKNCEEVSLVRLKNIMFGVSTFEMSKIMLKTRIDAVILRAWSIRHTPLR